MEVGTGPEGKEIPVKAAGVTGVRAGMVQRTITVNCNSKLNTELKKQEFCLHISSKN